MEVSADLRSDTLTKPTPAMREAMAAAPVGDDVYDEDPSIHDLESMVAGLLGHEAGLFCVSGSLSNQLGVASLVAPGQEVVCDARAHIARAEMGAHGALHGVTMRTWTSGTDGLPPGVARVEAIAEMLSPNAGPYLVSTAAVALENTHNFGGGTVQPIEHLRAVRTLCQDAGVTMHLDGARLWNAHVATGVPLGEYGALFDTVGVCFSKGLGAPVGSMLVSDAATIARARVLRKRMGAGWRQADILAAGARYAVEHHIDRLADDHAAARAFAGAVAAAAPGSVDPGSVQTNIVVVDTGRRPAAEVVAEAAAQGVLISVVAPRQVRAVTHLDVTHEACERAGAVVGALLATA